MTDIDYEAKIERARKEWLIDGIDVLIEHFSRALRPDQVTSLRGLDIPQLHALGDKLVRLEVWQEASDAIAAAIAKPT